MHLWQVSLAGDSGSLIAHLSLTFGGAPGFDVADSLDGAYLGPFKIHLTFPIRLDIYGVCQTSCLLMEKACCST